MTRARNWLIDLLHGPYEDGKYDYTSIGPECFAVRDNENDEYPFVICYRGENYVPMRPTLRTRLHNWLVSKENARV